MSGINRLELKQLRILKALLAERNASKVAGLVGLTQQAVSDQLKKMREIFDDPLFVRTGSGLIPTPKAELLGEVACEILINVEVLFEQPEFDPVLVDKEYTIFETDYAQLTFIPGVLARIWKEAPNLKVNLLDFDSSTLNSKMTAGEVDLALTFPDYVPETYSSVSLLTEKHICVAAATSTLVGRKLALVDIASIPQVIVSTSRPNYRDSVDDMFERRGLSRNVVMTAPCFSIVPKIIQSSSAIAFIPSRAMPETGLVELDIEDAPKAFELMAVWHARSANDPLRQWLLNLMTEEIAA